MSTPPIEEDPTAVEIRGIPAYDQPSASLDFVSEGDTMMPRPVVPMPMSSGGVNGDAEAPAAAEEEHYVENFVPTYSFWRWHVEGYTKCALFYALAQCIDRLRIVVPVAVYLVGFQLIFLRMAVDNFALVVFGLGLVVVGLLLFIEGLKMSIMPLGNDIGMALGRYPHRWVVMILACALGVCVTFAEPALGVLQLTTSSIDANKTPYLYAMLVQYPMLLFSAVSFGVGIATTVGVLRQIFKLKLRTLIFITVPPTLAMTVGIAFISDDLQPTLGLSWACGAVTTGPVTVPLVLGLGIGVAAAIQEKTAEPMSPLAGFGIVTLASIFPVITVLIFSVILWLVVDKKDIIKNATADDGKKAWYEATPIYEIYLAFRAILPLVAFVFIVIKVILRLPLPRISFAKLLAEDSGVETPKVRTNKYNLLLWAGILSTLLGLCLFNVGITLGLSALGSQSGVNLPALFTHIDSVPDSPLYSHVGGLILALGFAFVLGVLATLAEPALNVLGLQVEILSKGEFGRWLLWTTVSLGVALGTAVGLIIPLFRLWLWPFLIGGYSIAIALTIFAKEEYINMAWDSAGVTTGPVTVPLVITIGLAFSDVVGAFEGFAVLSMASIGPIVCVLAAGIFVAHVPWKKALPAGLKRRFHIHEDNVKRLDDSQVEMQGAQALPDEPPQEDTGAAAGAEDTVANPEGQQ
eukprot:TRINITY_DN17921_c0_g1_i1.p1 TRINITY_DN17921_c0_g1~~TRINITY_DN17921_c0_g1_i1.p1  ORF type:complete len:691 (-),score=184.92 TRINITY_DN17921_c0_g1_i1:131-2203(-)